MTEPPRVTGPVTVQVACADQQIRMIDTVVIVLDADNDEVRIDDTVAGYVHHAGSVFVALTGERRDHATECCQSLRWDIAAAHLVRLNWEQRHPAAPGQAPTVMRGMLVALFETQRHSV